MEFKRTFHLKKEKENFQDGPLKTVKWKTSRLWSFTSTGLILGKKEGPGRRKIILKHFFGIIKLHAVHQHEFIICLKNQRSEQVLQKAFTRSQFQISTRMHPGIHFWNTSSFSIYCLKMDLMMREL